MTYQTSAHRFQRFARSVFFLSFQVRPFLRLAVCLTARNRAVPRVLTSVINSAKSCVVRLSKRRESHENFPLNKSLTSYPSRNSWNCKYNVSVKFLTYPRSRELCDVRDESPIIERNFKNAIQIRRCSVHLGIAYTRQRLRQNSQTRDTGE